MPVKAGYLLLAGGGAVVVWSGIKGKAVSNVFRSLVGGNNPANLPEQYGVGGVNSGVVATAGVGSGPAGSPGTAIAGSLSQNGVTIYKYLRSNGWTPIQAAGATCSMWGESSWNPETYALDTNGQYSGGIMQWNGSNYPTYVGQPKPTGNATADLNAQLPAIIKYTNATGSGALASMNNTRSILSASQIFSTSIERAGISDAHATGAMLTLNIVNQVDPGSGLTA